MTAAAPAISLGSGRRLLVVTAALGAAVTLAVVAALAIGSVTLSPTRVLGAIFDPDGTDRSAVAVVRKVRIPRTIAAALSGASLAVTGAQMQTVFRNPLADPYVLGSVHGASFAVGVVVLVVGTGSSTWIGGLGMLGHLGIAGAAFVGSVGATAIALFVGRRVRGIAAVLVAGVMLGAVLSALVSIMTASADPRRLQQFVAWGFGSFSGVTNAELRVLVPGTAIGLIASLALHKSLDALLLGERYAQSMGLNVRRATLTVCGLASLLAGVVTAFAGPIGFIGIAAPHLARPLIGTSSHRVLLPASAAIGAVLALAAAIVAQLPGREGVLPLNAVTALIGAPVVVWVLVRRGRTAVVT